MINVYIIIFLETSVLLLCCSCSLLFSFVPAPYLLRLTVPFIEEVTKEERRKCVWKAFWWGDRVVLIYSTFDRIFVYNVLWLESSVSNPALAWLCNFNVTALLFALPPVSCFWWVFLCHFILLTWFMSVFYPQFPFYYITLYILFGEKMR